MGGGKEMKGKSTSSKEVAVEKLFWITAMYLFPRGLVVKLTSTVFSSFLQAVMFGSQRLPIERITQMKLQTLPSSTSLKGLDKNKYKFPGTHPRDAGCTTQCTFYSSLLPESQSSCCPQKFKDLKSLLCFPKPRMVGSIDWVLLLTSVLNVHFDLRAGISVFSFPGWAGQAMCWGLA